MKYEDPSVASIIDILVKNGIAVAAASSIGAARTFKARLNKGLHSRQAKHLVSVSLQDDGLVIIWLKSKYKSRSMNHFILDDAMEQPFLQLDADFDWREEAKFLIKKDTDERNMDSLKRDVLRKLKEKGMTS